MSKYSYFLLHLLILSVLSFFYFQDTAFLYQQWAQKKEQAQSLNSQIKTLFLAQTAFDNDEAQFVKTQQAINEWYGRLIKSADIGKLLREIKKVSHLSNLELKGFTVSAAEKSGTFSKVSVNMTAVSQFSQAVYFMNQIAQLPWLVAINDVAFGEMQQNNLLTSQLKLDVYSVR